MTSDHVLALLAAGLGLPGLTLDAQRAATLAYSDGMVLDIQLLDACEELRLTLTLGKLDAAGRHAALLDALATNFALACASPLHLAWEAEQQHLVLSQTLRFDQLEAAGVAERLQHLLTAARNMREQLQQARVTAKPSTSA